MSASLLPAVGIEQVPNAEADQLLTSWGHYLGPCNRPFGKQSFVLHVDGRPISLAISASTVSSTVRFSDDLAMPRTDLVELARLCTAPGERWATRVMLRLWREVHARSWPRYATRRSRTPSMRASHCVTRRSSPVTPTPAPPSTTTAPEATSTGTASTS